LFYDDVLSLAGLDKILAACHMRVKDQKILPCALALYTSSSSDKTLANNIDTESPERHVDRNLAGIEQKQVNCSLQPNVSKLMLAFGITCERRSV